MSLSPQALKEIHHDGRDLYHRGIKWIGVPCLLAYLAFALWNEHTASVLESSDSDTPTLVVTFARDSLLQMT
jgi:hypothetical protein